MLLILQLLVNAQYFRDALPLWHDIYNLLPHIHITQPSIYAYMAIGTYMINEKEAFNNSFELAAKFAADAVIGLGNIVLCFYFNKSKAENLIKLENGTAAPPNMVI